VVGFDCCDDNKPQELVTWITVNGRSRLYVDGGTNCLTTSVYAGDTLSIGSHGFECDFSCGERWDDDFATAPDDRIGTTRAAFTENENWGLSPGTYTLTSQPDLATAKSRSSSAGDYKMTITISQ
jgi:hypothetical protein